RKQPGAFTGGLLRKAWQILAAREIPRNLDLDTHAAWSPVLAALTFHAGGFALPASLLLPLAALGAAISARRDRGAAGLLGFALVYGATIVAFFPAARYRLPLAPIAVAFAAVGFREVVRRRTGIARPLIPAAAALGILAVSHPIHPATARLDSASEIRRLVALELLAGGDVSAAETQLDEALRDAPDSAENWNCLAAVRLKQGRFEEALSAATRATILDPGLPEAWLHRAMAAAELGDLPAAASAVDRALAARSTFSAAELLRARIARARSEPAEARRAAERAILLEPGNVDAGVLLAELLLEAGDPEGARRAVEAARRASELERDASPLGHASAPTLRVLARALVAAGDPERARRVLERAITFSTSSDMRAALEEELTALASRPERENGAAPEDGAVANESRTAD
ncbi:MAG: tetratricopeptide repeat protein, partial [Gemmatimonadetes bacterium]|nr:tetratricopeptide repeat protein [Gemmatimonadota bacterium]